MRLCNGFSLVIIVNPSLYNLNYINVLNCASFIFAKDGIVIAIGLVKGVMMTERIACAVWKERISPLFDASRTLNVVDISGREIINQKEILLENSHPLSRARELEGLGIHCLICGAISVALAKAIESKEIDIIPFTSGEIEPVIQSYINGTLSAPDYRMPGCPLQQKNRCSRGRLC